MPRASAKMIATDTEGIYRNEAGVLVDSRGVAVAFKTLRQKEETQREEILGHKARLPHELMYAIAFDPRYSLAVRMDMMYKAAPYYARKLDGPAGQGAGLDPDEAAAAINAALRKLDSTVIGEGKPTK